MPIYEFKCKKCGEITSFVEKVDEIKFFGRRCQKCRSRRLTRVMSAFSTQKKESMSDLVNKMRQVGNVQFMPQSPGMTGPPPGGCPYAQPSEDSGEKEKKSSLPYSISGK
ncbi:MAG: hypothetical protein NT056_05400 [Proteobacteria bacterium]|nr:hypothetical protein [Pseudomonadota bacterium]